MKPLTPEELAQIDRTLKDYEENMTPEDIEALQSYEEKS